MKKKLSIFLVILVVMSTICATTASGDSVRFSARYVYNILPSGGISLTSYLGTGTETVLDIPEQYEGHAVKALNFDELNDITYVEEITIPKTVEEIASNAFGGSCFLKKITVDPDNPFFSSLDGVLYNKDYTSLVCCPKARDEKSFTVPSTVKTIKEKAFELTSLTDIVLPEGLETIENKAFWYAVHLENINFPSSLRYIGENGFCSCMKLSSIHIPEGITEIKTKTFDSCTSLEKVVLPPTVTTIGEEAFMFCKNLKSVVLPAGLTTINGGNPFLGDTMLESLVIDSGNSHFTVVDGALYSKDMTRLYYYPHIFSQSHITLPSSLVSIEANAFKLNDKIVGIKLPNSIRYVMKGAFSETSINTIEIPEGVKRIDERCFASCKTLKKITLPKSLESVGMSAFFECSSLKDVYYSGSRKGWNKVKVDSTCNNFLLSAKHHYALTDPTAISVPAKKISMYVKATKKIGAKVTDGVGKTNYTSLNKGVAKVSGTGIITAVKKGTARIRISNNGVNKVVTVTVKNPVLNKTNISLKKKKSYTLRVTGRVGTAKFKTSNKKVATVSSKGKVTAKKKGTATISVKTNGITLKCKVKVKK